MKKQFFLAITLILTAVLAVILFSGCQSPVKPAETEAEKTTEPVIESTTEPTEEPTTEPETENPAVSFFKGIWQGSDSNVTTIVINEDGTLYYREINSAKIPTVEGMSGTWTAKDTEAITMSIPGLGSGYELEGIVEDSGGVVLKCTNGQPWSDETIRKSTITQEEIEEIAKKRVAELSVILPADGGYFLRDAQNNFIDKATITWNSEEKSLNAVCDDGLYVKVTQAGLETNCTLSKWGESGESAIAYPAGTVKSVSGIENWWLDESYDGIRCDYYSFEDWGNRIVNYSKESGAGFLFWFVLYVYEGEIYTYQMQD
jgi:hypothetical protein